MKQSMIHALATALQSLKAQNEWPAELEYKIQVERTRDPQHGDFASNIAMILAKPLKQNPLQLANQIVEHIPTTEAIEKVSVAPPGFINFSLKDSEFQNVIPEILQSKQSYGRNNLGRAQSVHMEIMSANPTGPLHVGRARVAAYSASLANVLEAGGYKIHREYYVNDSGRQTRILAVSVWLRYLELCGETVKIPLSAYHGAYIVDVAQALKSQYGEQFFKKAQTVFENLPVDNEENKEQYADALVERVISLLGVENFHTIFAWVLQSMIKDIREDLKEFGVECDEWFYESQLAERGDVEKGIEKLREGGYLYERDGAVWFRSTDLGDEKDRVVFRENGQPTYFASDIGYHLSKYERGFDLVFDIYGADHHGYVPRLRALVQALDKNPETLQVLLVQFAILYRGKTRASMSTRAGEFVTLRELREEVGNDAARFFYITRKRDQHLDFDLELAKAESSENPVYYIQYANARICSVFRQLEQRTWNWDKANGLKHLDQLTQPHERKLLRTLSRYPEVIETAITTYEPSVVAYYLQELANDFHTYYNAHQFLVEEKDLRDARMSLIATTQQVLVNGLNLLGLSTPDMM